MGTRRRGIEGSHQPSATSRRGGTSCQGNQRPVLRYAEGLIQSGSSQCLHSLPCTSNLKGLPFGLPKPKDGMEESAERRSSESLVSIWRSMIRLPSLIWRLNEVLLARAGLRKNLLRTSKRVDEIKLAGITCNVSSVISSIALAGGNSENSKRSPPPTRKWGRSASIAESNVSWSK